MKEETTRVRRSIPGCSDIVSGFFVLLLLHLLPSLLDFLQPHPAALCVAFYVVPRIGRSSQPGVGSWNPFGIKMIDWSTAGAFGGHDDKERENQE